MIRRFFALVVILTMFIACSQETNQENEAALAKVNNEILTYEDLLFQIPPQLRYKITDENLLEAVETWINTEVLYQKAVEDGLDKEPDVKAMIRAGIKETLAKKFIETELTSNIDISPVLIDSIFHARKEQYKLDEDKYRASHILLDDIETAKAIYERLKKGANFNDMALDYSKDRRSADNNGDIGYFTADQLEPTFAEAVRKMKIGSFSKPVKTSYGYHIIKLTDRKRAGSDLDSLEAKNVIREQLFVGRHAEAFQKIVDSLRAEAIIERFPIPGAENSLIQNGR